MSLKQTFNPPLTPRPRKRGLPGLLVEGEDFLATCPPWASPVADGAWPEENGWYIAVSLIQSTDEHPVEAELVWVQYSGDKWHVNEAGADKSAERRDFYWVGKVDIAACAIKLEQE